MEAYSALLMCKGVTYHAQLNEENLCFTVNGVKIEVEFDGSLYIESPFAYTKAQLRFLSSQEQERSDALFLTDFSFQYALPVKLLDKESDHVIESVMTGCVINSGTNKYTWLILNAQSSASDMERAIFELQEGLSPRYALMACCCCKYGQGHPYGGDAYINFLCFRKSKRDYERLGSVGKTDWAFFSDAQKTEATRPLYDCQDYIQRTHFG